jgi:hypothetical protein
VLRYKASAGEEPEGVRIERQGWGRVRIGGYIMEIRKIPTEKLNPAAYNPRKDLQPGDPEYEKLKRSMQEFGKE